MFSGLKPLRRPRFHQLVCNTFRNFRGAVKDQHGPDLLSKNPFDQFAEWMKDARKNRNTLVPNVMCLSTANSLGVPSGRIMRCKSYTKDGFQFSTCYDTRKCLEMDCNPSVALTFFWEYLNRMVRIEGCAKRVPPACGETDKVTNWGSYIVRPVTFEFWQRDSITFWKPTCRDVVDGRTWHEGEDGWYFVFSRK